MPSKMMPLGGLVLCILMATGASGAEATYAPSRPGVDMPELSALGSWSVGTREETIEVGPVATFALGGVGAPVERKLHVRIWYPTAAAGAAQSYVHNLKLVRGPTVTLSTPSIATPSAPPVQGQRFPLVVVSHGLGGWNTSMTYLTENLASKGYVVAAIDHEEPAYRSVPEFVVAFENVVLDRARDQRGVIRYIMDRATTSHSGFWSMIDPTRMALVGYSMGGFGALATAGAGYDPNSATLKKFPPSLAADLAASDQKVSQSIRALVLIAPWGAQPAERAWTPESVGRIGAPTLLIDGDKDDVVDYANGTHWIFDHLTGADRYMLVFEGAGHGVGSNPPPPEAHEIAGLSDYFTDPVWRTDRIDGVEIHFITAFLNEKLKGDKTASSYLNVPTPIAAEGNWPQTLGDDSQPKFAGSAQPKYWRGFQYRSAVGLEIHNAPKAIASDQR